MTQDQINFSFKKEINSFKKEINLSVEVITKALLTLLSLIITAIQKALQCLWIPITIAWVSFELFYNVDQTKEIYRSFAQDEDWRKIILSTIFVFGLSFFIWFSGHLLAFKSESSCKEWSKITSCKEWSKITSTNKLTSLKDREEKAVENLTLECVPIISGFLPLLGLGIGISSIISDSKDLFFSWCVLIWAFTLLFFFLTLEIFSWRFPLLGSSDNEGLYSENTENIIATLQFIFFAAITIPFVRDSLPPENYFTRFLGVSLSGGVFWVFILCIFLYVVLLLWNSKTKKCLLKLSILSIVSSVIFLLFLPPVLVPDSLGAISIAALALTFTTVSLSTIYDWGRRFSYQQFSKYNMIPAVSILIVLALVFSELNTNDNHQIRHFERIDNTKETQFLDLKKGFHMWLCNREDIECNGKGLDQSEPASSAANLKEYPVYIVSAEGGGIFAAYHAAITLSRLTDKIKGFSSHVFAISSVSGGSVGATAYSSLVKNNVYSNKCDYKEDDKETFECAAHQLLDRDFLSPLLAMAFYPDLLQRFIPFPINDWDRARGLEVAFEESWDELNKNADSTQNTENPFKKGYSGFWTPDSVAPALVLNTTIVETGERLVFSPFKFKTLAKIFEFKDANFDIPLSTTAFLSARFPIVTPVGWIDAGIKDRDKFRLADGGYFDNSGVVTAIDITSALKRALEKDHSNSQEDHSNSHLSFSEIENKNGIKIKIINLAIVDTVDEKPGSSRGQGLNELLSPVRALLNVRETREETTFKRAESSLNRETSDQLSDQLNGQFRTFLLNTKVANLPLGWLLSQTSQENIRKQIGMFEGCNEEDLQENYISTHNNCVAESIKKDLMQSFP